MTKTCPTSGSNYSLIKILITETPKQAFTIWADIRLEKTWSQTDFALSITKYPMSGSTWIF